MYNYNVIMCLYSYCIVVCYIILLSLNSVVGVIIGWFSRIMHPAVNPLGRGLVGTSGGFSRERDLLGRLSFRRFS